MLRCPSPLIPFPRGLKEFIEKFMSLLLLPELETRKFAGYPGLSESFLLGVFMINSIFHKKKKKKVRAVQLSERFIILMIKKKNERDEKTLNEGSIL